MTLLHKCWNKQYNHSTPLREHVLKVHDKNTPFHCSKCPRKFWLKSFLKGHMVRVHERVKCEMCSMEICNSFMLKRHKAKVHGVKKSDEHHCRHCIFSFTHKSTLLKHIAKIHPEMRKKSLID